MQDVERCMPENVYFREKETQKKLLNILFIFCKLNVDVGYRQGMHEVLAPVLWVVSEDAIDGQREPDSTDGLLLSLLDPRYTEHDAFTLFCLIMQTAKSFYETGGNARIATSASSSPIVERSRRIHDELLRQTDPELADHLHAIEILPQIFVMYVVSTRKVTGSRVVDGGFAYCLDGSFHSRASCPYGTRCLQRIRDSTSLTLSA